MCYNGEKEVSGTKSDFEKVTVTDGIKFRYAKGRTMHSGAEIHPFYEILFFIKGDAEFISEKERMQVAENTLFLIPVETFHRFDIRDQGSYERCVFNFSPPAELNTTVSEIMTEIRVMGDCNREISGIFSRLKRLSEDAFSDAERETMMKALFYQLLMELRLCTESFTPLKMRSAESLVARAMAYIDTHYREKISVEAIARDLNVSKSLLSHYFKCELNVSVYRYVTEKRLAYANRLIRSGVPITEVSRICGYGDYSVFYRAYTKMFGKINTEKI